MVNLLVIIALFVAGPLFTAFAQGTGSQDLNCNGLSDADCQVLKDSAAAMQGVHSLSIPKWSLTLDADIEGETTSLAGSGSATVILPEQLVAMLSELPTEPSTNLTPLLTLLDELDSQTVQEMLSQTAVDLVFDQFIFKGPDQNISMPLEVALKDNILYMHASSPNGAEVWFGEKLVMTSQDLADVEQVLDELRQSLESADVQEVTDALEEMSGTTQALSDLASQYVVTTRGEDQILHGQTMLTFTTTIDIIGLLNDDKLPGLLLQLLTSPSFSTFAEDNDLDLSSLNEKQIRFVLMSLALAMDGSEYSVEQWIGADDQYTHYSALNMTFVLDGSAFDIGGGTSAPQKMEINMSAAAEMTDFNAVSPDAVTIPLDYEDMDSQSDFLPGDTSMIKDQIKVGQTVSRTLTGDSQDIYSLDLKKGDAISVTLESDGYPTLSLYGPDGFQINQVTMFEGEPLAYTATEAGTYLLVVEGYYEMDYELTVEAES
jgi:hypothetical protein